MEEILKMLASSAGTAGIILAWHLLVVNYRLKKIDEALDRLTRTDLIRLVASPHVGADAKEAAGVILQEVDAAEADRKKTLL